MSDLGWFAQIHAANQERLRIRAGLESTADAVIAAARAYVDHDLDINRDALSDALYDYDAARWCGRLLIGQGDDTYDPICTLPKGHEGRCQPQNPGAAYVPTRQEIRKVAIRAVVDCLVLHYGALRSEETDAQAEVIADAVLWVVGG